jgi:hypothetical protein
MTTSPKQTVFRMFQPHPPGWPIDRAAAGDRHPDQGRGTVTVPAAESPAQVRAFAVSVANQDYADYHSNFLVPAITLMVQVGLWIALETTIGFIVGLGLSSLMGQRTVAVILLIVLELILTPIFSRHIIFAPPQRPAGHRRRGHGAYRTGGSADPLPRGWERRWWR